MSADTMSPEGGEGKPRRSISKKTRFNFKRDAFTCQYCGRKPPAAVLELEHLIPVCQGGGNEETNLLCSCFDCNRGKAGTSLDVVPMSVVERLARERELVEQVTALNHFQAEQRKIVDEQVRRLGWHWNNYLFDEKNSWVFGRDRQTSIRQFLRSLTVADIEEAIDLAMCQVKAAAHRDEMCWKYFCKICWNWIKGGKT